jgi:hypothetical protein
VIVVTPYVGRMACCRLLCDCIIPTSKSYKPVLEISVAILAPPLRSQARLGLRLGDHFAALPRCLTDMTPYFRLPGQVAKFGT